jgi:hypothetical protein
VKELEKELAKQVKKNATGKTSAARATAPGELPYTGVPVWAIALAGLGLVGGGVAMRRL